MFNTYIISRMSNTFMKVIIMYMSSRENIKKIKNTDNKALFDQNYFINSMLSIISITLSTFIKY